MTEAEPKSPGHELRAARERLGLSVQDVAIATKINAKVLKALEEGDRDVLPAKSFARGFIRSYAAYLKIDAEPILAAYNDLRTDSGRERQEAEVSGGGEVTPTPAAPAKTAKSLSSSYGEPSIASRVAIFAVIFVLVGLIIFVKKLKDKYEREKITPAVPISTTPAPQNNPTSLVETTLQHGPVATLQQEPATDSKIAAKPDAAHPDKVTAKPAVPAKPAAGVTPTVPNKNGIQKAKPVTKPTAKPTANTVAKPATKPHAEQNIIIEALDNVDVTIRVGHEPPQTVHLVPQAVHTIKANDTVELNVSDGGMVNIIQNGRDRGVPGQLGKAIKLKYP